MKENAINSVEFSGTTYQFNSMLDDTSTPPRVGGRVFTVTHDPNGIDVPVFHNVAKYLTTVNDGEDVAMITVEIVRELNRQLEAATAVPEKALEIAKKVYIGGLTDYHPDVIDGKVQLVNVRG